MESSDDERHRRSRGFRVGDWVVRPDEGVIIGPEHSQALEPRVMQLLVYLAERAGQVISADQLLIDIWRGPFYGDSPVHKCVALLRRALGDDAQAPIYIQTLRKRGYRLIASVSMPEDYAAGAWFDPPRPWRGESPYVGLRPFTAAEFGLYFGRTRALAGLLGCLREQLRSQRNLLLVLGPSGIGKSSLLRAGLLPKLGHAHGFDGIRIARHSWIDLARECSSGADLDSSLTALAALPASADSIAAALPRSVTAESAVDPTATGTVSIEHALVLDHLEAIVHSSTPAAQREALDGLLTQWAERSDLVVFLLARSDAYPLLLQGLPHLAELKAGAGHYDVPPVGRGEIAEMIRGPARLAALSFEYDAQTRVRLDDALLDAAADHPACLPLLQYTLQQLYDRRDPDGRLGFAAYAEIGGLAGAIASRAETVFLALDPAARAALPTVLAKLVRIESTEDLLSGRSVDREQIDAGPQTTLVEALVDARLLIASQWRGRASIQLAHDALLREWPRASAWAQDNRRLLNARHQLGLAADRWQQGGQLVDLLLPAGAPLQEASAVAAEMGDSLRRHERDYLALSLRRWRRQRRWRWSGLGALLLSAMLSVALAYQAQQAQALAERQRRDAEVLVDFLLDDLSDRLRTIGRLDLLASVTAEVTRYLDQASAPADPAQRLRRSRALRNLAEVSVGQGQKQSAAEAISAALTLLRAMPAAERDQDEYDLELGTALYWRGYLALQEGRDGDARDAWEGYLGAAQSMLERRPDNANAQLEVSYALNNLGSLAMRAGQLADAAKLVTESIAIKRTLYQQTPERADIAAELADSISWLGSIREQQGQLGEALEHYANQRALLRSLQVAAPDDQLWQYRQTTAMVHMGQLQLALGHSEPAWELFLEATDKLQALVARDHSNRLWQRDLAFARLQLGWLAHLRGKSSESARAYALAETTLDRLLAEADAGSDWLLLKRQLQLRRLISLRDALTAADRAAQLAELELAFRQLRLRRPEDIEYQLSLALALYVRARWLPADDQQRARLITDEAINLLQPLVDGGSDKRVLALWVLLLDQNGAPSGVAGERLRQMGYRHPEMALLRDL